MKKASTTKLIFVLAFPWFLLIGSTVLWSISAYIVNVIGPSNTLLVNIVNWTLGLMSLLGLAGIPLSLIFFLIMLSKKEDNEATSSNSEKE